MVGMIAREQQFAEKIHAYTPPRSAQNSRVKDLVDLALPIGSGGLNEQRILDALRLPFEEKRHTRSANESGSAASGLADTFSSIGERMRTPK
jgi:Nucleotidyl transferase AbiEii toxin, Type IV TA system